MPISEDTPIAELAAIGASPEPPRKELRPSISLKVTALKSELERLRNWAPSAAAALLDQGLISGSNFLMGVILAHWGGPESYGGYMAVFAVFLLIANLYQAILLEPTVVLAFSLFPSRTDRYVRVLLRMHAIFSACFVAAAGAVLLLAPRLHMAPPLVNALSGLLISAPCVLLFWLARSFSYIEFSPGGALAGSVVYFGMQTAGLVISYFLGGLTPRRAFLSSACAACAASLYLLRRYRQSSGPIENEPSLREVWLRQWNFGRWGSGTAAMSWAQLNSMSFTSGYFLGLSGIGALNAMIGLLLPMTQVVNAAVRIALPSVARIYTVHGSDATHWPVLRVGAALTAATTAYCIALAVLHGPLFRIVYGQRFLAFGHLVPIIALSLIPFAVTTACEIGFNGIQQPQASFPVKVVMLFITVPVSTVMTWRFGLTGAALAVTATSTINAVCMAVKLRSVWRQQSASMAQAAD